MIIADLAKLPGGTFPARRWGRGLVGQLGQPIAAKGFSMGYSILEPKGGQVPWHNQEQEEVYFIVQGEGEICVGTERSPIKAGQAVFMPPTLFHQLTNTGDEPMHMIYVYCPGGDVAHWRQELTGSLRTTAPGEASVRSVEGILQARYLHPHGVILVAQSILVITVVCCKCSVAISRPMLGAVGR